MRVHSFCLFGLQGCFFPAFGSLNRFNYRLDMLVLCQMDCDLEALSLTRLFSKLLRRCLMNLKAFGGGHVDLMYNFLCFM